MKLNLGCSDQILPGFENVDIAPAPGVSHVCDLNKAPWPWANSSVQYIRAHDIIEHLINKIQTMNECHRILTPGGTIDIVVPTTGGTGAFQDPTHVSYWNERSFLYYESGNPYRERFAKAYGVTAAFRTLRSVLEATQDGPKLSILLSAVK